METHREWVEKKREADGVRGAFSRFQGGRRVLGSLPRVERAGKPGCTHTLL
jgi:hypothetical protein